jgi:hypothetical protein
VPLLDHFHAETEIEIPWPTMTQAWAVSLMGWLNRTLPRDEFQALTDIRMGTDVAADVLEYRRDALPDSTHGKNGAVATQVAPPAVLTLPANFADEAEIEILEKRAGRPLVGVIELVSPANKDRPASRDTFVAKCVTYLSRGIGLVIIDAVTERHANLHNELVRAIGGTDAHLMPDTPIYVSGYHPVRRRKPRGNEIDIWPHAATVGLPIPSVPLGLKGGPVVMLDLEGTYTAAIEATGL